MHISENQGSNLEPSPEEKSGYIFRKIFLFKIGPGEKNSDGGAKILLGVLRMSTRAGPQGSLSKALNSFISIRWVVFGHWPWGWCV